MCIRDRLLNALKLRQEADWEVFNAEKRARMEAAEQNNVNDTNGEDSSGASSSTAKTVNAVNVQRGKSMKGMKKLKQSLIDSARKNINNISEHVRCVDDGEQIPAVIGTGVFDNPNHNMYNLHHLAGCYLRNQFDDFTVRYISLGICLLYTSPSPRDKRQSRMPSSA